MCQIVFGNKSFYSEPLKKDNIMSMKSLIVVLSVLLLFSVSFGQIKLPDTPEGNIVSSYLRIFNAGDEPALRDFFTANITARIERAPN
jgi:hypothetical protein